MSDHRPVLLAEVLEGLALVDGGSYVDGTYGRGGHSAEILARIGGRGRLLAMDKDPEAVAAARARFGNDARFTIAHAGFEHFKETVEPWLEGHPLAGVCLDLGVSSPQLDEARRGFSFSSEGPLDMRMDTTAGQTAAEWLAEVGETELATVLRRYGEEPRARAIAAAIVRERERAPIDTTSRLAAIVERAAGRPRRPGRRTHAATRTFQAIRIAINEELESLKKALGEIVALLAVGGRMAVISFHSLEDRIVKQLIAAEARGNPAYAGLPSIPAGEGPRLKPIGRLIRPGEAEQSVNPRARSARLRIAEKIDA